MQHIEGSLMTRIKLNKNVQFKQYGLVNIFGYFDIFGFMKGRLMAPKFQIKFEWKKKISWNLFCSHIKYPLMFNKQENCFPSF